MDTPFADSFTTAQLRGLARSLFHPSAAQREEDFYFSLQARLVNHPDPQTRASWIRVFKARGEYFPEE